MEKRRHNIAESGSLVNFPDAPERGASPRAGRLILGNKDTTHRTASSWTGVLLASIRGLETPTAASVARTETDEVLCKGTSDEYGHQVECSVDV